MAVDSSQSERAEIVLFFYHTALFRNVSLVMRHCTFHFVRVLVVLLLLVGAVQMAWAAPQPLNPKPGTASHRHDQVCRCTLLQSALEAGGCDGKSEHWQAVLDAFCQRQRARLAACATRRQQVEELHRVMHAEFLTGSFRPHAFRLESTLEGESYNCLTSTVLFLCLCRELDLPATAVAGPAHVFCRVQLSQPLDVQTTRTDVAGAVCEAIADDTLADGRADELSDEQLLARVYYNRGTSLLVSREPGRALPHFTRSHQLDPNNRETRQNLLVAGNEWALELCDQHRFAAAAGTLRACLELERDDPITLTNDVHVHHQWVTALCQEEYYARALDVLDECHQRRTDVAFYDRGRWAIYQAWAARLMEQGAWPEAEGVFADAAARYPGENSLRESELSFWRDYLDGLQRLGRHAEAARFTLWLKKAHPHLTRPVL